MILGLICGTVISMAYIFKAFDITKLLSTSIECFSLAVDQSDYVFEPLQ